MSKKPLKFPTNSVVGVAFILVGITSFLLRSWLDGGLWTALALAFLAIGDDAQPWNDKPIWRRISATGFSLIGVALLIVQVVITFRR